jgi:CheY-like chemotaxis protein
VKRRALVVEDEVLLAMMIEDMLGDLGHDVTARAARLSTAVEAARTAEIDFAMLDINLNGQTSFPAADVLAARGVPFVFATGYGARILVPPYLDRPVLQKPFSLDELRRALEGIGITSLMVAD